MTAACRTILSVRLSSRRFSLPRREIIENKLPTSAKYDTTRARTKHLDESERICARFKTRSKVRLVLLNFYSLRLGNVRLETVCKIKRQTRKNGKHFSPFPLIVKRRRIRVCVPWTNHVRYRRNDFASLSTGDNTASAFCRTTNLRAFFVLCRRVAHAHRRTYVRPGARVNPFGRPFTPRKHNRFTPEFFFFGFIPPPLLLSRIPIFPGFFFRAFFNFPPLSPFRHVRARVRSGLPESPAKKINELPILRRHTPLPPSQSPVLCDDRGAHN